ncbi:NO-inducible flavohemoprotein [Paenibacillus sp. WLX2291]|uniref:NO-inducible flavohemoprotein n=1 Tax=Paenibacillus sp. WLX2291 TaxID=3296934 RepID=UPI0039845953
MLDAKTIQIIQSTIPVLETEGVKITRHFYETMFHDHPELLNIFNHANQKQGRQQTALANAVYAAAQHIDRLDEIIPVVKQIAHKHRSLGVLPEHYPIVGRYLLAAIRDVLGDAATPDILEAWGRAYEVIAEAFIGIEQEMYAQAEHQWGGWSGFQPFVVQRKEQESAVITSFYLVPQSGGTLASFEPGQYVSVKVHIPGDEFEQIRQYSLSAGSQHDYYRISVRRADGNEAYPAGKVSMYLHQQVQQGDVLWLSAPAGDFALQRQQQRPIVLLSGGVGLTPITSMLHALLEQPLQQPVVFIHATHDGEHHALREEIAQLEQREPLLSVYYCYTAPSQQDRAEQLFHREGYMEMEWLQRILPHPAEAEFYFCGPFGFMKAVHHILEQWDVPIEHRHYEYFGPAVALV